MKFRGFTKRYLNDYRPANTWWNFMNSANHLWLVEDETWGQKKNDAGKNDFISKEGKSWSNLEKFWHREKCVVLCRATPRWFVFWRMNVYPILRGGGGGTKPGGIVWSQSLGKYANNWYFAKVTMIAINRFEKTANVLMERGGGTCRTWLHQEYEVCANSRYIAFEVIEMQPYAERYYSRFTRTFPARHPSITTWPYVRKCQY